MPNSTESYSVPSPLYLSFNSCGIHQMEIVLFSEYVTMCLFQCYWMLGLLFDKGGPVAHGQKLFSKPMRALQEQYRMLNETVHELITQSKDAPQSPLLCFVCGVIDHVQLWQLRANQGRKQLSAWSGKQEANWIIPKEVSPGNVAQAQCAWARTAAPAGRTSSTPVVRTHNRRQASHMIWRGAHCEWKGGVLTDTPTDKYFHSKFWALLTHSEKELSTTEGKQYKLCIFCTFEAPDKKRSDPVYLRTRTWILPRGTLPVFLIKSLQSHAHSPILQVPQLFHREYV